MKKTIYLLAILLMSPATLGIAQEPTETQIKFFESKIRPALTKYCYECHSVDAGDSRGGLLVDSREGLLEGGDSGPAIEPGEPDQSVFWEAITWDGYEMPPSKKMPDSVIADFKKWIEMGAPDPRVREILKFKTKITSEDIDKAAKDHWAFQPPKSESGTSIDGLVEVAIQNAGLKPSPPADSFSLLRRINFDLIGLPPTPTEIKAFHSAWEKDADAAVKSKIDELLNRPQYGERWGRHWLDVARYAESSGSRNFSFPHAWRYRDYVIDSFNDDTSYDRFISEQIAGDLLPTKTDEQWQKNLIATGFLAIGLKHLDQKNPRIFTADMVDEQIDTMTQAVLGLTVACARCHDHKFDPIPTDDYYAMAGIFRSTKTLFGTKRIAQNHRAGDLLLLPILDENVSGGSQSVAELKKRQAALKQQIASMGGMRKNKDNDNAKKELKSLRNAALRIQGQLDTMNPDGSTKTFGMGVQEADQMVNANILLGGEVERPAQEVDRGFLQVLGDLNFQTNSQKSSGRRQLADSMTSKNNPLTARVMANRIWMHLLGAPLVSTPNNFGFSGVKPDNQALLDHLAVRFMQEDWSVKSLIREIMLTETYRRSSQYNKNNYAVDPENKLFWRANPRQLDAEAMRDAMLALSGNLDLKRPYGSAVAQGGDGKTAAANINPNIPVRSVYLPIIRDEVVEPLKLFGFPDANISSAGRQESIVPTQALYMMNGEFVSTQAQQMAASLESKYSTTNEQVRNAFLWTYGRPATDEEIQASVQFFKEFEPVQQATAKPALNQQLSSSQTSRRRTGGRVGQGGGRRRGQNSQEPVAPTTNNQRLVVFCQTLMASARFRILN